MANMLYFCQDNPEVMAHIPNPDKKLHQIGRNYFFKVLFVVELEYMSFIVEKAIKKRSEEYAVKGDKEGVSLPQSWRRYSEPTNSHQMSGEIGGLTYSYRETWESSPSSLRRRYSLRRDKQSTFAWSQ